MASSSSLGPILLFWCWILFQISLGSAKARHLYFKWEVGYVFLSPDCEEKVMIGINQKFPGPAIRARAGDNLVVELTNKLPTEGVVIHWHGIRQIGTPWADGTASISQCAINPEETFFYNFTVEKPGTYFYHGHFGMQRSAGLYGSLIVDVPLGQREPFHYNGELNLLLSDWWHMNLQEQMLGLSSNPFRWINEPQSLLIDGKGQFNCSFASAYSSKSSVPACDIKNSKCSPHVMEVQPNMTYRLRIASTTALSSLSFAIVHHKMTIVEADGNYVEPVTVDNLDIYSGESYSVIIRTDQNPTSNYWASVHVRGRLPGTNPGLAILNYRPNPATKLPASPPAVSPLWNDTNYSKSFYKKILAKSNQPKPPIKADRTIILLNTQNKIDSYIKWAINNISLILPATPYLGSIKHRINGAFDPERPPENYPENYDVMEPPANPNSTYGSSIYRLQMKTTVDVILQNSNALTAGVSEIHPWHLHGHDFWVLGYGEGKFQAGRDEKTFNLKNPPLKNTVVVFPFGWTALRFVADNPGVWAFHCHIEPHLHMGMGVVFEEGVQHVGHIPSNAFGCGMMKSSVIIRH